MNFLLYGKQLLHCGGVEDVACSNPPQAESFAGETLSYSLGIDRRGEKRNEKI